MTLFVLVNIIIMYEEIRYHAPREKIIRNHQSVKSFLWLIEKKREEC